MKKVLLSSFVILTFVIYSIQQRHGDINPVIAPTIKPSSNSSSQSNNGQASNANNPTPVAYKDGTHIGNVADAVYGNIQVEATIQGGKIADIQFLQYPNDRANSIAINQQAMPYLRQEAIRAQSAKVNSITGASDTSAAFVESLSSALIKAQ